MLKTSPDLTPKAVAVDPQGNIAVSQQGIIGRQIQSPVENWMSKRDARLHAPLIVRLAISPRVRELKPDDEIIRRSRRTGYLTSNE